MKILLVVLFTVLLSSRVGLFAQDCEKGDYDGRFGRPQIIEIIDPKTGKKIRIVVIAPRDPNEIIGPSGYDSTIKWVSSKAPLPYKVLFENDPNFATAPAQKVTIHLPIHPNLNPSSLRIGDFGFGSFIFNVPPNTAAYTKRVDVRDSLGVFVDVTAGLDFNNRQAFWIFESIDPATGIAGTLPAGKGFLPINNKAIHNGEGFVSLTLQPSSSVRTGDSVMAKASIVFDVNDAIPTDVWNNVVDAVAPASKIDALPASIDTAFTVSWTGHDDSLGSGIDHFDLYVSKNNGPFGLYKDRIDSGSITFSGDRGAAYSFFTLATDHTGNKEPLKNKGDQSVAIRGTGLLVSARVFLQGAYTVTDGMMIDSLRSKGLLPTAEPYTALGYTPVNRPLSESIAAGALDSAGNKGITDWIWMELRSKSDPAQISASRSALLRRDGMVVDVDGSSPVYFNNLPEGSYFVALRHRNHLGVMSATPLPLNRTTAASIDFTSPTTEVYGTNAQRNVNGVAMLWAGDVNGDKRISYNGSNNDKNAILSKVGLRTSNNILTLYDVADLNLDGRVSYNGASNDKNVILSAVGLKTPNNIIVEQMPK